METAVSAVQTKDYIVPPYAARFWRVGNEAGRGADAGTDRGTAGVSRMPVREALRLWRRKA